MEDSSFITLVSMDTSEGVFELWQQDSTYILHIAGVEPIGLSSDVIAALDTIIDTVKNRKRR